MLTVALLCVLSLDSFGKPLKVFILAGQSNMEGQGVVSMDGERDYNGGKGNLVWSMKNSKSAEKMKCLKSENGPEVSDPCPCRQLPTFDAVKCFPAAPQPKNGQQAPDPW